MSKDDKMIKGEKVEDEGKKQQDQMMLPPGFVQIQKLTEEASMASIIVQRDNELRMAIHAKNAADAENRKLKTEIEKLKKDLEKYKKKNTNANRKRKS